MEKILNCVMDIGEQMLICGAEVHRVEDSVSRICSAFGLQRADVFIITSCIIVTVRNGEGKTFTQTRRIHTTGTDIEKLHLLNQLSRDICQNHLSIEEINTRFAKLQTQKAYPFWAEVAAYACIAGAFTLFFGGNVTQALLSFVIGGGMRFVALFAERFRLNRIFSKFLCSMFVTALAFLCVTLRLTSLADQIIIGNIMTLIPGIGLTNALRDLFIGDSISGLLRLIEAGLIALAIAAGYFAVAFLAGGVAI